MADPCWCSTCRPVSFGDMRMVLCPVCGNKRCPRASNHVYACTGSNEVGQVGVDVADMAHRAPQCLKYGATMDQKPVTEIHRYIYVEGGPQSVRVMPGSDGFGVLISTSHDRESKDWFGAVELNLTHELAEALGHALIAASKEKT